MTTPQPPTEHELVSLLRAVQDGDDADALVDNRVLSEALGLSLEAVARCLEVAKDHSLIWGTRGGLRPGPWFSDLELTVQGRRFLAARTAQS